MVTFGISSWSVHRSLQSGALALFDFPAVMREHGFEALHLCHFHLPSREQSALDQFQNRMEQAGVKLDTLLLDFGDISHPETGSRDVVELETWLPAAFRLGARFVRISAGAQTPTEESLARSAGHLLHLAKRGVEIGVRVITENWHAMVPGPREAMRLREMTHGQVPLCLDFGNWSGPDKYKGLEAIAPSAATVHAKCAFSADGVADKTDFDRCFKILRAADFVGTIALIYDGTLTDEWKYLDEELSYARVAYDIG
jgi:sugar phosphate isomerase/epimerase